MTRHELLKPAAVREKVPKEILEALAKNRKRKAPEDGAASDSEKSEAEEPLKKKKKAAASSASSSPSAAASLPAPIVVDWTFITTLTVQLCFRASLVCGVYICRGVCVLQWFSSNVASCVRTRGR
jgi:hypothetical protein